MMPQSKKVLLYARLSVTTDESVSIERQLESGRKTAEARGWEVVGEYVDDGVSASRVKPEDRVGWRAVLAHEGRLDAVIVWKIDRLARRVLDFLHADESLQERGAGIVAVEDPIDMTTPQGRAFAVMLSVFAELEAATISARVKAAREAILKTGRRAGGRPPFGFMNIDNPAGPGVVLAHDPERIEFVREMTARAMAGDSLYSISRWLEAEGVVPRARAGKADPARWHDASVEAVLRAPSVAGLTAFRGDLLRDRDGLPVVDESVAILSTAERRQMLATLDAAKLPGTRPQARKSSALLGGIVRCGSCDGLMYRATAGGKYRQYRCQQKGCRQPVGIARDALEEYVVEEVLRERGQKRLVKSVPIPSDNDETLVEIEAAIRQTTEAMAKEDADVAALVERLQALKSRRVDARAGVDRPQNQYRVTGQTFGREWERVGAEDVEARRQLLIGQLEAVRITPGGGRGRAFDCGRAVLIWRGPSPTEKRMEDALQSVLNKVPSVGRLAGP
ncbi:recombinase family protein [Alloalcanivorax gelatiniphagus]